MGSASSVVICAHSNKLAQSESVGRGVVVRVLVAFAGAVILVLASGVSSTGISQVISSDGSHATPTPLPGKPVSSRNYLNGVYADPPDTTTPRLNSTPWDYTINNSYQDNCRGCGVSGLANSKHYPVIIDLHHVQPSYPDFAAAASGAYNEDYRRTAHQLVPYAREIYAVRVDSEFNGPWAVTSPYNKQGAVDPSIWIAGFRNLVLAVREALPGVKIIWNPAVGQQNPFPYYPGDDVVDLIGPDVYCQPDYYSTSAACWDDVLRGASGWNLDAHATFAKAHSKPMVIPEWGDTFGDGIMIRHMREWMDQAGVVAQSYWDSGDAMSHTAALPVLTVNQQAYVAEFGHRPYTGSYWPRIIRVPAATLPH